MFDIKDSGSTRAFGTGSIRDNDINKEPMELIPMDILMRVSVWLGMGAKKYGGHNWRLGQPQDKVIGAMLRHLGKYMIGDRSEDHLAAMAFAVFNLMNVDMYFKDNPSLYNANEGLPINAYDIWVENNKS